MYNVITYIYNTGDSEPVRKSELCPMGPRNGDFLSYASALEISVKGQNIY